MSDAKYKPKLSYQNISKETSRATCWPTNTLKKLFFFGVVIALFFLYCGFQNLHNVTFGSFSLMTKSNASIALLTKMVLHNDSNISPTINIPLLQSLFGIPYRFILNISSDERENDPQDYPLSSMMFLNQPNSSVSCFEKTELLILVKSAVTHFKLRSMIRKTWANNKNNTLPVAVVFLIGVSVLKVENIKLNDEAKLFQDIVRSNFIDSYRNLTLKVLMGLKWVSKYCSNVKWVMSVDDDTFVDTKKIFKLYSSLKLKTDIFHCGGILYPKSIVMRSGKWFVPFNKYDMSYYPPYCGGFCYLMSADVAIKLYNTALVTHIDVTVDDAFISGILRKKARLHLSNTQSGFCEYLDNFKKDIEGRIQLSWKKIEKEA